MNITNFHKLNIEDHIEVSSCPHCASTSIVRNGHKNHKQQYKCKQCSKRFQASTGTPTHWMHHTDKLPKYINALHKGMTIRSAAKYTGISNTTSFSWRHKLISSIKHTPIIETNKNTKAITLLNTPYNAKGRKKAPEKFRKDSKTILIQQNNQICIQKLEDKSINKQIIQLISLQNKISTAKKKELTIAINKIHKNNKLSQKQLTKTIQNNLTSTVKSLNQWMKKFRGVATKYLQQYWNWFTGLTNIKALNNEQKYFSIFCTENYTLQLYRELRLK